MAQLDEIHGFAASCGKTSNGLDFATTGGEICGSSICALADGTNRQSDFDVVVGLIKDSQAKAQFYVTSCNEPKLAPLLREIHPEAVACLKDRCLVDFLELPHDDSESEEEVQSDSDEEASDKQKLSKKPKKNLRRHW